MMIVKGKIVGKDDSYPFEIRKDEKGISLRVELPGNPFEHSTSCSCLEPLEFLGLLLPAIEEEIGEIKGVFVEEVVEERKSVLEKLKKALSRK